MAYTTSDITATKHHGSEVQRRICADANYLTKFIRRITIKQSRSAIESWLTIKKFGAKKKGSTARLRPILYTKVESLYSH